MSLDRVIVGSFSTYPEARQVVSDLAERIPAEKIQVVGEGLQAIPGRSGHVRALVEAGTIGTAVGALAILFASITMGEPVPGGITIQALVVGAVCGLVAGFAAAFTVGISSPRPAGRLYARRYDVAADPSVAATALREIEVRRLVERSG
jgi:hypothetical protein